MLKKIADLPKLEMWKNAGEKPCYSSDHNPPSHIVLEPGVWEHKCSSCGKVIQFTVNGTYM